MATTSGTAHAIGTAINNTIGGTIINNHSTHPQYSIGSHTHNFNNISHAYGVNYQSVNLKYNNVNIIDDNKIAFQINDNGDIKINAVDVLPASELTKTFQYILEEYPNVYADLILKGIIK